MKQIGSLKFDRNEILTEFKTIGEKIIAAMDKIVNSVEKTLEEGDEIVSNDQIDEAAEKIVDRAEETRTNAISLKDRADVKLSDGEETVSYFINVKEKNAECIKGLDNQDTWVEAATARKLKDKKMITDYLFDLKKRMDSYEDLLLVSNHQLDTFLRKTQLK